MKATSYTNQPPISPKFIIEYKKEKHGVFCVYDIKFLNFEAAQQEREKLLQKGFFEPRIKRIK